MHVEYILLGENTVYFLIYEKVYLPVLTTINHYSGDHTAFTFSLKLLVQNIGTRKVFAKKVKDNFSTELMKEFKKHSILGEKSVL